MREQELLITDQVLHVQVITGLDQVLATDLITDLLHLHLHIEATPAAEATPVVEEAEFLQGVAEVVYPLAVEAAAQEVELPEVLEVVAVEVTKS